VPEDKFRESFGESWQSVLADGTAMNAKQACDFFGISADELNAKWKEVTPVKFGGGFYCAKMQLQGADRYIFNAFFMTMRSKFTKPSASIRYYAISWSPMQLSWADFRSKVIGSTDPTKAQETSMRRRILNEWQALGLTGSPDGSDNGVHASASPFEGFAERSNWLENSASEDAFGKVLLEAGVSAERIAAWSKDPQVNRPDGSKGSVFDALEDLDSDACLNKFLEISKCN